MKAFWIPVVFAVFPLAVQAAITVPGADGSDGALNITANTTIDLSQAVSAAWNQGNGANAGKGVYDASKWAVVFKYSSVNVAAGATLTFKNHGSRAPVVWLVSGNVTIAGTVSLDGARSELAPLLAEPGPGGFRGGSGYISPGAAGAAGFGVGGGLRDGGRDGFGGSYGSIGGGGPAVYGNPSLIPLLGGSGGGGNTNGSNGGKVGGGAGGGAILVASTGAVSITGALRANGGIGDGNYWDYNGGGGSGGGIRIVADSISGAGVVNALGGTAQRALDGGLGRIRLERVSNPNTIQVVPDPSVVPLAAGATALIWPPANAPEVRIVSVGGQTAPADPRASFGSAGADVSLPQTTSTPVVIETTNVEQASQVQVRLTPRSNANATVINATVESVVSTSPLVVRWTANLPVATGYSAVQVKVVRP